MGRKEQSIVAKTVAPSSADVVSQNGWKRTSANKKGANQNGKVL